MASQVTEVTSLTYVAARFGGKNGRMAANAQGS
jgi:hypothetical protein